MELARIDEKKLEANILVDPLPLRSRLAPILALITPALAKIPATAIAFPVKTAEERAAAKELAQQAKGAIDEIHAKYDKTCKEADALHKGIVKLIKDEATPFERFILCAKNGMTAFDAEAERIRKAEEARLQAIENERKRKEEERIQQEIAKQRAIEEEARRKVDEARRAAEQASAEEKARLLKEAEAAERKANAAAAKAEVKEEQAATLPPPAVISVAQNFEKGPGEVTKMLWKADMTDKAALIKAAAEGNDLAAACLVFDDKAAKNTKGVVVIPGVRVYQVASLSLSGR